MLAFPAAVGMHEYALIVELGPHVDFSASEGVPLNACVDGCVVVSVYLDMVPYDLAEERC